MSRRLTPARAALWCAALSVLSLTITSPTSADTFEWTDSVDGAFSIAGISFWTNITGGAPAPPNVGDIALFNEAGAYSVTMLAPATSDEVFVTAGSVTFREINPGVGVYDVTTGAADVHLDGGDLTLGILDAFDPDTTLNIGDLLEIQGGSTLSVVLGSDITAGRATIGSSTGAGTAIVDGAGSTATINSGGIVTIGSSAGGTGTLIIQSGGTFTTGTGTTTINATGTIDIQGSTFNANGNLLLADSASTLTLDGGALTATAGLDNTAGGTLDFLDGTLTVTGGAFAPNAGGATDDYTIDGPTAAELPQLVVGAGATASIGRDLFVGINNQGELTVEVGGMVSNTVGIIANNSGSTGTATVTGSGSTWTNSSSLEVGRNGQGTLNVEAGGMVFSSNGRIGTFSGSIGTATVTGSGSTWTDSSSLEVGRNGQGTLNVEAGGMVFSSNGFIGSNSGSDGTVIVDGSGSKWTNTSSLSVGNNGMGSLAISAGGEVSSTVGIIGDGTSGDGTVTVGGASSKWTNSVDVIVGFLGMGSLAISAGGEVSSTVGFIGNFFGSDGTVTVDGAGSKWINSSDLIVGSGGMGSLAISAGGEVSSTVGFIGRNTVSEGTVTVSGVGSTWTSFILIVGGSASFAGGTGILTVDDGGLVDVSDTLKIWDTGAVAISGGTIAMNALDIEPGGAMAFNFGTLNFKDALTVATGDSLQTALGGSHAISTGQILQVDGTTTLGNVLTIDGGTFSTGGLVNPQLLQHNTGTLQFTGAGGLTVGAAGLFGPSLSIGAGQNLDVTNTLAVDAGATLSLTTGGNISAGAVSNSGQLSGSGTIAGPLTNNLGGEVQGLAGTNLVLTGSGNTNNGQVTLSGGQVHFTQDFTNSATGLVIGNGTLRADGGTTNDGDMAFSATANVIGDVTNNAGGTIISAGGTTTFFDDVTNNGEIRTSESSFTVYFGSYSGNGDTGTGTVIMEGDLKPGSSPGTMAFGGDLSFCPAAGLEIEIGGLLAGSEFDQVTVADAVSLGGALDVSLLGGFAPNAGDTFEIITASSIVDSFDVENLPDLGGLVWNVSYSATNVVLEVVSPFTADFDLDGDVDGDDLTDPVDGWQARFGIDLDGGNFLAWQRQFGSGVPPLAASQAVPEPASGLLSLLALGWFAFLRKLRKRI